MSAAPARPDRGSPLDDLTALVQGRTRRLLLLAILLAAACARLPGVLWGTNFPIGGWARHHPDERTHVRMAGKAVDPSREAIPGGDGRFRYPPATGVPLIVPIVAHRIATGTTRMPPPSERTLVLSGRVFSALYGVATVLVIMLFAQRLWQRTNVSVFAGALAALAGLHVTQSHFFLADVPALFWYGLGLYLLFCHLERRAEQPDEVELFQWSAFAFGAACGLKLTVFALPSLGIAALLGGRRVRKIAGAAIFFGAGFAAINAFLYTPFDLRQTLATGVTIPFEFDRAVGALLYAVELPSVFGLPVVVMAAIGMVALARGVRSRSRPRLWAIGLSLWLPTLVAIYFIVFTLDPFPRHLLSLLPAIVLPAAFGLSAAVERLRAGRTVVPAVVLGWQALFVFDGERVFLDEPRNDAARWVQAHLRPGGEYWWWMRDLPGYTHKYFDEWNRPPVLLVDMHYANHYLTGVGWRNSFPRAARNVFMMESQSRLELLQALFRGETEYREVARFREGYFMPEYVLTNRLLGDRSRSYVTEIRVFRRPGPDTTVRRGSQE